MRRTRLAAVAALVFLLVSLVPVGSAAAAVPQPPSSTVVQYNAVTFNGSNGWAVGGYFAGGHEYAVVTKTTDGGAHWSAPAAVEGPTAYFTSISIVSATTGWATSSGVPNVWKTTNGGSAWTPVPVTLDLTKQPFSLTAVRFYDATHGFVGGRGAYNEPVSWKGDGSSFSLGYDEPRLEDSEGNPTNNGAFVGVGMANATNAIVVGSHSAPSAGSIAFRTTNGSAWTTETLPALPSGSALKSVAFPDTTHAYAVGTKGAAAKFNGSSWTAISTGATDLNAVATKDATHAFAVGAGGTILGYDGSAWTPRTSGTSADLRGVAFSDATVGCAVGSSGTILRTTDGGGTWTPAAGPVAPVVSSAGFTNSVAYDILSLLKTSFKFTADQPNVNATLTLNAGTAGTWTLVNNQACTNGAGQSYTLKTDWDGKNPVGGAKAPYAASYDWTLTVSKNGQSTTKTGKITLSNILFYRTGTSANNVPTNPAPTGYMIVGGANMYMTISTASGGADSLDVLVTGPNGYSARPKTSAGTPAPFAFGPATTNVTAYLNGTNAVKARAIHTFTMKGQKNVSYKFTVIQ